MRECDFKLFSHYLNLRFLIQIKYKFDIFMQNFGKSNAVRIFCSKGWLLTGFLLTN